MITRCRTAAPFRAVSARFRPASRFQYARWSGRPRTLSTINAAVMSRRAMSVRSAAAAAAAAIKPHRLSASVIIAAAVSPQQSAAACDLPAHVDKISCVKQADALPGAAAAASADGADFKICLLQRTAKSSFMPDVMVFPGGAVDAEDAAVATELLGQCTRSSPKLSLIYP